MKNFYLLRYAESGQIRDRTDVIYAADLVTAKAKLAARVPGASIRDGYQSAAASGFRGAGRIGFNGSRTVAHPGGSQVKNVLVMLDSSSVLGKLSPSDRAELEQDFQGV